MPAASVGNRHARTADSCTAAYNNGTFGCGIITWWVRDGRTNAQGGSHSWACKGAAWEGGQRCPGIHALS